MSHTRKILSGQGFTLVELMIVIAVAAILIATVTPSFGDLARHTTVTSAASEIVSGLQLARSEAVRRSLPTVFELVPGSKEWKVYLDKDGSATYGSADELLRYSTYHERVTIAPAIHLRFSPAGVVNEIQSGSIVTTALPNICIKNGDDAVRLVKVKRTGLTLTQGRDRADRAAVQAACS
jgi:type IV fimbrial biogenesis protein FimT